MNAKKFQRPLNFCQSGQKFAKTGHTVQSNFFAPNVYQA